MTGNLLKAVATAVIVVILIAIIVAILYFGYLTGIVLAVSTFIFIAYQVFKSLESVG